MAVPVRRPNGQLVGQPGSNGGVHRGPDLGLRRNVMEGMLMRALIRDGLLIVVDAKGKCRLHRSKIPMAMVENLITRLQQIVLSGTDANVLRLVTVANEVFRPGPHEKNGNERPPMPATFVPGVRDPAAICRWSPVGKSVDRVNPAT